MMPIRTPEWDRLQRWLRAALILAAIVGGLGFSWGLYWFMMWLG